MTRSGGSAMRGYQVFVARRADRRRRASPRFWVLLAMSLLTVAGVSGRSLCGPMSPRTASVDGSAAANPIPSEGDSTPASPQPPPRSAWWVVLATGPMTVDGEGAALAFSHRRAHLVWSLRAITSSSGLAVDNSGSPTQDFGAIVSYAVVGRRFRVSAGAGIGTATYNGKDGSSSGVSVPFEFQAAWLATHGIGLGLYGWANSRGPFAGLGIALNFGRLR